MNGFVLFNNLILNPMFIGPLPIKYAGPKANYEMLCPKCHWSSFAPTEEKARLILLEHIEGHFYKREYVFDVSKAPGFGGAGE